MGNAGRVNFNDTLALILTLVISLIWVLQGSGVIKLQGEVIGTTIAAFTLIIQYYYRKAPNKNSNGNGAS